MNLRRKIALWLCPELPQEIAILGELRAMNAQMAQLVEHSKAASEHAHHASRAINEVTEGGNAMRIVCLG